MILDVAFHWSPVERRVQVRNEGLRPYSEPADDLVIEGKSYNCPYICLSPTPSMAYSLSGASEDLTEVDEWDLWQVRLREGDDIRIRRDRSPQIQEIKVYSPLPADRLWYVGVRHFEVLEPRA